MCSISVSLKFLGRKKDAAIYYQKARDVGAAHGFFSVESAACMGLGQDSVEEGREEEGLDLLRNALVHPELQPYFFNPKPSTPNPKLLTLNRRRP
jgi:hypothetical protein